MLISDMIPTVHSGVDCQQMQALSAEQQATNVQILAEMRAHQQRLEARDAAQEARSVRQQAQLLQQQAEIVQLRVDVTALRTENMQKRVDNAAMQAKLLETQNNVTMLMGRMYP